jgi:hypothetical protein
LTASQALYQLSYAPVAIKCIPLGNRAGHVSVDAGAESTS